MTHDSPHDRAADAVHEGRPVEAQYVRGGRGGVRILLLLIASAGAAALLLLGIWTFSKKPLADAEEADNAPPAAVAFDQTATAPSPDAPTTATGQPAAPAQ